MEEMMVREAGAGDRRAAERLFHRDLPGGGFVAIELSGPATTDRRVRVVVERRGDRERRVGHKPPIIHDEPWSQDRGIGELYRMACDNVAIARGLLRIRKAD
ncbi:MAG TPA: hypothetical protein VFO66_10820 [Gemmatimonadaceae bacterium]|nr:hypothetical protein [Gemmatimonadaceae bacterium]